MPIAKWKCPKCQQTVDLDHFEKTTCGLYLPADYAQSVLDHQEEQFPDGGTVRVSSASGCPRAAAIMATEDVTVDPLAFNTMHTGTAWHKIMSSVGEYGIVREVEVEGTIDGIEMRGHIDRVLRVDGVLFICDWKHQKDGNRRYQTEPKSEHIVQTSLYAELYEQTFGERPEKGVIWYHYTSSPGVVPFVYDLWSIDQCMTYKPLGGETTVAEILHDARRFAEGKTTWETMPLTGKEFNFGGKTGCDYCTVRETCLVEAQGAPY